MNDVVLNKITSIQRCVKRAREEYAAAGDEFETNYSRQDAALLNVQRACEQAIDLANLVIKSNKLGVPVTSVESFQLLCASGLLPVKLSENLERMVRFRNLIVHQYKNIDLAVVRVVLEQGLDDVIQFCDVIRGLG